MKNRLILLLALPLIVLTACERELAADLDAGSGDDALSVPEQLHGKIVLGKRLENPYSTENMQAAYSSLYSTRSSRDVVSTTHLYVRFLPENEADFRLLESRGLVLFDYPLDYEILVDGDYYTDPELPEGSITWQYSVVEKNFDFPDMRYEIIEECCLDEGDAITRSDGVDFAMLEREAFRLTGNGGMLGDETKAARNVPQGRLTVSDANYNAGEGSGVAGVKVVANSFVKVAKGYTDGTGHFKLNKSFSSSKVKYRIVFENERGFALGFNFILVPASVSSLGKQSSEGIDMNFTFGNDRTTWRRCIVNNVLYEYFDMCGDGTSGILPPPSGLRLWMMDSMTDDYTLMLHHGAVWDDSFISEKFPKVMSILKSFLPDVLLGTGDCDSAFDLYREVYHEAAHASHYAVVGNTYWNQYALATAINGVTGKGLYGTGGRSSDGYIGLTEMWAYYYGSYLFDKRYRMGLTPGEEYWFKPQMLRALEDAGLSPEEIFALFDGETVSLEKLGERIEELYGSGYKDCFDKFFGNPQDDSPDDSGSSDDNSDDVPDGGKDDEQDNGKDDLFGRPKEWGVI